MLWRTIFPPVVSLCDGVIKVVVSGMAWQQRSMVQGRNDAPRSLNRCWGDDDATNARSRWMDNNRQPPTHAPPPPVRIPSIDPIPAMHDAGAGTDRPIDPRPPWGPGRKKDEEEEGRGWRVVGDWRLGAVGLAKPSRRLGRHARPIEVHSIRSTDYRAPASNETTESGMRDGDRCGCLGCLRVEREKGPRWTAASLGTFSLLAARL